MGCRATSFYINLTSREDPSHLFFTSIEIAKVILGLCPN